MNTRKELHFELPMAVTRVETRVRKRQYMLAFIIRAPESESLLSANQLFPLETPQLLRDRKKGHKITHSTKI